MASPVRGYKMIHEIETTINHETYHFGFYWAHKFILVIIKRHANSRDKGAFTIEHVFEIHSYIL